MCQKYFLFLFLNFFFQLISLHFSILEYNIINFTIPKDHFLNYEID
jgi:hypothetical protein